MEKIVWLASYPRSGNTWMRFLLAAYAHGDVEGWGASSRVVLALHHLENVTIQDGGGVNPAAIIEKARAIYARHPLPDWLSDRILFKTHYARTPEHPLLEQTDRIIYLLRNPRDVALSGFNFHAMKPDVQMPGEAEYVRQFIRHGGDPRWARNGYGTWSGHADSWLEQSDWPVLMLRYRELRADARGGLRRMLEFLGAPIDERRIDKAVRLTSLEELRRHERTARTQGTFIPARDNKFFFGQGQTGRSLKHLGAGLDRAFDERFGPDLARYGYPVGAAADGG